MRSHNLDDLVHLPPPPPLPPPLMQRTKQKNLKAPKAQKERKKSTRHPPPPPPPSHATALRNPTTNSRQLPIPTYLRVGIVASGILSRGAPPSPPPRYASPYIPFHTSFSFREGAVSFSCSLRLRSNINAKTQSQSQRAFGVREARHRTIKQKNGRSNSLPTPKKKPPHPTQQQL